MILSVSCTARGPKEISTESFGSLQGWKGDEIVATNYVEVGIKLPKAGIECSH